MQHFIDDRDRLIEQALDGVVAAAGGDVVRLPADSGAQVVLRADRDADEVAIVSGGGSGHEPTHAGFVGPGMLTAAVCGDVFASPSVDAVLTAILAVTGDAGCLLVVKNYTGDRLNFGLAAERARSDGLDVEIVVVADDVSRPDADEPRGLAGTLFVHKIAGHAAAQGADLASVAERARSVASRVVSMGVARTATTVPGTDRRQRIDPDEVEVGLGIHNEPGVETVTAASLQSLVDRVTDELRTALGERGHDDGDVALLVNDLGGMSHLEMSALVADVAETWLAERTAVLIGPAALLTSLDMAGFSLSALALADDDADALRSPTGTSAWPGTSTLAAPAEHVVDAPAMPASGLETAEPSDDATVRAIVEAAATACTDHEEELNRLDEEVGDGDTGTTFAGAGRAVLDHLDELPLAEPAALCRALASIATRSMGGSSGALLAILFEAAAQPAADDDWAAGLRAGLDAMMEHGGAEPGDRTLIDALDPAVSALEDGGDLSAAAAAAREGADATSSMGAGAGRSAYVDDDRVRGVVDPGAEIVARMFEAAADAAS